ncbi:g7029 [Coccomyxa elongata]
MHSLWLSSSLMALLYVAAAGAASDSPIQGFATQYGGRQDGSNPNTPIYGLISGACGYGAIPQDSWPYWQVAALGFTNPVSYSGVPQKWGCGACIQVTCTGAGCATTTPFVVLVTDTCKDCAANQINMNALTYNKYISPTDGRKAVTWQQVPCSPPGNIVARVTAASRSYLRLVLMQVAGLGGVKSVEFRKPGSDSWIKMDAAWGANWQSSSSPGAPLDLRITPNDGSAPLVAPGAISAAAPGDYDTGVQLGGGGQAANASAIAATANATAPYLGPPVGPQQIPAVAAANATAVPVNATAGPVMVPQQIPAVAAANATAAPATAPIAAPVAAAVAVPVTAVPVTAPAIPVQAATAPTNFTMLTFPGAAQSSQAAKPVSAGQPTAQPVAAVPTPAATAAVPAAATPAAAASNASAAAVAGGVPAVQQAPAPVQASTQTSKPAMVVPIQATPASAPAQATPPVTVPAPVQATPAVAPVLATPPVTVPAPVQAVPVASLAQASPPVTVPAPVEATPPSPTAAVPSPAAISAPAASSPAASSSSAASPPQAAAVATGAGTAPAPVSQASGNPNQPFSLNFDRTAANLTSGSTAAAPSVNSAVEQILNPKVTYNSGGRRLA